MDRRTALKGLAGAAGAGVTLGCGKRTHAANSSSDVQTAAPAQPPVRLSPASGLSAVSLAPVPIGAGGFVTGIEVSGDGEFFLCRTDVANAYARRRDDRYWTPLFTTSTMVERL